MQALKQKWVIHRTYKRLRKQWDEYKATEKGDMRVACRNLTAFLDAFQTEYSELLGKNELNLDTLYGDCSEILVAVLGFLDREVNHTKISQENDNDSEMFALDIYDLINKSLSVAGLILQDEKYRTLVKDIPQLIPLMLDILDKLKTPEAKKLAVRVISHLGENDENKFEIGRLNGFNKLLHLLVEADEELTIEVLKTIRHFLDLQKANNSDNPNQALDFRERISKYITEVSKMFSTETQKIVPNVNSIEDNQGGNVQKAFVSAYPFPPVLENIEELVQKLSEERSEASDKETKDDATLKELMRVQGALTTLTHTLNASTLSVQLDLVMTISKLVFHNKANQEEMRKIGGYSFFLNMFESIQDYSSFEAHIFLKDCFGLIYTITLDGNRSRKVGNLDALNMTVQLIKLCSHHEVRTQALNCVQDIIATNPINAVFVKHVGGIETLFQTLESLDIKINAVDTPNKDDDIKLASSIIDLLNYLYFLLSAKYSDILVKYIQLAERPQNDNSPIKLMCLRSVVRILCDARARNINLDENFCNEFFDFFVKDLSAILGFEHPALSTDKNDDIFYLEIDNASTARSDQETRHNEQEAEQQPQQPLKELNFDKYIFILEIIGLLIKGNPRNASSFERRHGLTSLMHIIAASGVPPVLVDAALWVLRELYLCCELPVKYLVSLTRDGTLPFSTRLHMLSMEYELMNKIEEKPFAESFKAQYRELGGIDYLLSVIKSREQEISNVAFFTLGEALTNCDATKQYIAEKLGVDGFVSIVDCVPFITSDVVDVTLEFATSGSIKGGFDRMHGECASIICKWSSEVKFQTVYKPLFTKPIPCQRDVSFTLKSPRLSKHLRTKSSPDHKRGGPKRSSMRTLSLDTLPEDAPSYDQVFSPTNAISPVSSPPVRRTSGKSNHLSLFSSIRNNSGSSTNIVGENFESRLSMLSRVVFWNTTAGLMVLNIISRSSSPKVQRDGIKLIILLLQVSPNNAKVLCQASELIGNLITTMENCEEEVQSYYSQLIACLGSYTIRPEDARLLFEKASRPATTSKEMELQKHLLYVIGRVSEAKNPPSYFNFDGVDGHICLGPFTQFPSPKVGYTFSCWSRLTSIASQHGSTLLSWHDKSDGGLIFRVFFKKTTDDSTGSSSCFLCLDTVQLGTNIYSKPVIFSQYSFVEGGDWHHILLNHSKESITLFIDGEQIATVPSPYYPRIVSKDRPLHGYIGCAVAPYLRDSSNRFEVDNGRVLSPKSGNASPSLLHGQVGTIYILNGKCEDSIVQRWSRDVSASYQDFKLLGIDSRELIVVHPNYIDAKLPKAEVVPALITSPSYRVGSPPLSPTSTPASSLPENDNMPSLLSPSPTSIASESFSGYSSKSMHRSWSKTFFTSHSPLSVLIKGGVDVHLTRSMKDVIQEIGGIKLCFPLIALGQSQQVAGLRTLIGLLHQSHTNASEFNNLNGFNVLFELLSSYELSMETFDLLFDLVSNSQKTPSGQPLFVKVEGIYLIMDLIRISPPTLQLSVFRCLLDMLVNSPENMQFWRSGPGIYIFLVYLLECKADLLQIIEYMCSDVIPDEIQILSSFILGGEGEALLVVKNGLLNMVYNLAATSPAFLDAFNNIGGLNLVFSIIDSPFEDVRVWGIKLLGLIIHVYPRQRTKFLSNGFDVLKELLSQYDSTTKTFNALLRLSLDSFLPQGGSTSPNTTESANADKSNSQQRGASRNTPNTIVYVQGIRVLIELMAYSHDEDSREVETLEVLESLLDAKNMAVLQEQNWLDWWSTFFLNKDRESYPRVLEQAHSILKKMIYHDLAARNNHRYLKLFHVNDMVDVEEFQLIVIEDVLELFEDNARLPNEDASNILKNLSQFYDNFEDNLPLTVDIYFRVIWLVNKLTSENTPEIRNKMRTCNMFEMRDKLILQLLRTEDLSIEHRLETLTRFPLESLAEQCCFREGNVGVIVLLKLFFETDDISVKLSAGKVIRNIARNIEETKKVILRILGDQEVVDRMLRDTAVNAALMGQPNEMIMDDHNHQSSLEDVALEEFITWFFADFAPPPTTSAPFMEQQQQVSRQKHDAVLARLAKAWQPVQQMMNKKREASIAKRASKLKRRTEELNKARAAIVRGVNEFEERRKQFHKKCLSADQAREQAFREQQETRVTRGRDTWELIQKQLASKTIDKQQQQQQPLPPQVAVDHAAEAISSPDFGSNTGSSRADSPSHHAHDDGDHSNSVPSPSSAYSNSSNSSYNGGNHLQHCNHEDEYDDDEEPDYEAELGSEERIDEEEEAATLAADASNEQQHIPTTTTTAAEAETETAESNNKEEGQFE